MALLIIPGSDARLDRHIRFILRRVESVRFQVHSQKRLRVVALAEDEIKIIDLDLLGRDEAGRRIARHLEALAVSVRRQDIGDALVIVILEDQFLPRYPGRDDEDLVSRYPGTDPIILLGHAHLLAGHLEEIFQTFLDILSGQRIALVVDDHLEDLRRRQDYNRKQGDRDDHLDQREAWLRSASRRNLWLFPG